MWDGEESIINSLGVYALKEDIGIQLLLSLYTSYPDINRDTSTRSKVQSRPRATTPHGHILKAPLLRKRTRFLSTQFHL